MKIFLYNPLAKNKKCLDFYQKIKNQFIEYNAYDVLKIDLRQLYQSLGFDDEVIILGGDGTLNFLVNSINGLELKASIYLYALGTGNDFSRSIEQKEKLVLINEYIKNLPTVIVNNKEKKFVNSCGIGLDGYVCYLVNKAKNKTKGKFLISTLKGFLFFKKRKATIIVDDVTYKFKRVFLSSILEGGYCGGGMLMGSNAKRNDGLLDLCVIHNISKLKILMIFKSIYKGEHIKYKKNVFYIQGRDIKIQFDKGSYFQMDGESFKQINEIEAFIE